MPRYTTGFCSSGDTGGVLKRWPFSRVISDIEKREQVLSPVC